MAQDATRTQHVGSRPAGTPGALPDVLERALAVGTDGAEVALSGAAVDLARLASDVADLREGEVVRLRCGGLPSVAWPDRLGRLELVGAGSGGVRVAVQPDRVRVELDPDGAQLLQSALEAEAAAGPGSSTRLEHLDGMQDGVAPGSVPLVVGTADPPSSPRAQQDGLVRSLLDDEHRGHPDAVQRLGRLLADDPGRRLLGVASVARALLADAEPACHDAMADVLVDLVAGDVPVWGIGDVMADLLARRDGDQVASRRRAVDRVLAAWTAPRGT